MAQAQKHEDKITFHQNVKSKKKALRLVNKSLKKHGDLGVYGDLSAGLTAIARENSISIEEQGASYWVTIWPDSEAGHDFSMSINKISLKISDVVVGNVEPPPGDD